jgi:hypothetical protein
MSNEGRCALTITYLPVNLAKIGVSSVALTVTKLMGCLFWGKYQVLATSYTYDEVLLSVSVTESDKLSSSLAAICVMWSVIQIINSKCATWRVLGSFTSGTLSSYNSLPVVSGIYVRLLRQYRSLRNSGVTSFVGDWTTGGRFKSRIFVFKHGS